MRMTRLRGFTLIEMIIFIVVVAAGMAGILQVINTTVARSADPMVRKQAIALADSVLEEVLQKAYTDPGGGTGETTRATFDDVDDYNGKTQTIFTDWAAAGLSSYNLTISVSTPFNRAVGGTAVQVKTVTVTVSRGTGADAVSVSLSGYRTNY
jgi:MSHA pilin protein MshD